MEPSRVVHPSAELLRALAVDKLDEGTAARVRSHLDSCPACRAEAAAATNSTLNRPRPAQDSYATQAPAQSLSETARPPQSPPDPTALANLPPELASQSDYEVLGELGRGGMGVVYQARHKLSGRLEVLKVMNKALIGQADSRERFLREIQAAARLDHRNVVKMHTALERGELMVLVMEYVEGEDLARILKARGPLPVLSACSYAQQTALGLQHAFERGMIHRDIKPQNLMLARDGKKHIVKILDFGLAKATRNEGAEAGLTVTGAMMGTPGYVAPEQSLNAATADIRSDIYSLGCTLYHLLAGAPPFSGKSAFEIMQAHHAKEAAPLDQVRLDVPPELAALVRKMMAKKPDERHQTPADVVQALGAAGKLVSKSAPPPSPPDGTAPATKGMSDEVKNLLRAPTVLQTPEAAQLTMLGQEARSDAAQDILSANKILSDQSQQITGGHDPLAAANTKRWNWVAGIAACGVLLVLAGIAIWIVFSVSQRDQATPDRQVAQAKDEDPTKTPREKGPPQSTETKKRRIHPRRLQPRPPKRGCYG